VRYLDRGHAETQTVDGEIRNLRNDLVDQNLKGIDDWFARQNHYARRDADYELAEQHKGGGLRDLFAFDPLLRRAAMKRLAWRVPARGLVYFLYSYFWRMGFLDGRDGFIFCLMRSIYQSTVAIKKYDQKRRHEICREQAHPPDELA
jgi:hypothetical protein